ncbi:MAG: hypothetical protein HN357_10210, partial [Chloroflexi bacterium]|nr:hypothetical protein [Chloroflexota bacterium]MBT6989262.1 hypothetical protein [Chloroflexota bacterium]
YPILVITAGFAIYEPIKMEANWIDSPIMAFPFIFLIPFVVIGFITPNSIVGERIAKTLEPLLATPARNISIVIGKTGMAVLIGWGVALVNMLIGLIVVNIFHSMGEIIFYPIDLLIGMVLGSLLLSIFISVAGINSSLYSATLFEAQNKLVPFIIPLLIPAFVIGPLFPKYSDIILVKFSNYFNTETSLPLFLWIFLIVDLLLFVIVLVRFDRERLLFGEFYSK